MNKPVYQYEKNGKLLETWSSRAAAARYYGVDESSIRKWCKEGALRFNSIWSNSKASNLFEKKPNLYKYEELTNSATISSDKFKSYHNNRVKVLNEFLQLCQVDLSKWEVDKYSLNAWDVTMSENKSSTKQDATYTNYQIKVFLKKKELNIEESINNFIDKIPSFKFSSYKTTNEHSISGYALEMAPLDAHLGKLAWEYETGYRNYDLEIASEDYSYAVDQNLEWSSSFNVEKIFFLLGQDLFHVDNIKGRTTNGEHDMDVDGRMPKIYEVVFETTLKSIYKCRKVAPVEIVWIPGNHDFFASMALAYTLKEHFRNDSHVNVDVWKEDGKITRKARLWGNLLVGWTHRIKGKENTWGNELAQAFPKLWGESVFREWHFGDQHRKHTLKTMPEFTSGGVLCRQLTALSPVDKWHFENMFTDAIPGGEAYIWSKDKGVISNLIAWTGQYGEERDKLFDK